MKPINDIAELRKIQLDILKHVDAFCKQNGIKYFLSGGSMIGAVRHHGYIPWDDDIDLMLLRDDYERLISLYTKKDNSEFKLHHFKLEKGYLKPFVKIDNSNTILEEYAEDPIEMGVNIDIFPIDVVPNEKSKQIKMYKRFQLYKNLINIKIIKESTSRAWYKNLLVFISHQLLSFLPMKSLIKALERNAIQYKGTVSDYCGVAVWGYGVKEINLRKNWDDVMEVDFENTKAPIPCGYDNYLTSVYGNYMQLPPEEKRVSEHLFRAWWK